MEGDIRTLRKRKRGPAHRSTVRDRNSGARRHIMATSKLEKAAWQRYFDQVSKTLVGKQAEIEVASLQIGDQIEAEWVPLLGISYDPKSDIVEVLVEGLDHLIQKPVEIYIEQGPAGLASLEVIDADDVRQIVRLRDPLMLPYSGPA
jgi:hypothetical protein